MVQMIHQILVKTIKLITVKTVNMTDDRNILLVRAENSLRIQLYEHRNFVQKKTITNSVSHFDKTVNGAKIRRWLGS